jgi:hypothetical protein
MASTIAKIQIRERQATPFIYLNAALAVGLRRQGIPPHAHAGMRREWIESG